MDSLVTSWLSRVSSKWDNSSKDFSEINSRSRLGRCFGSTFHKNKDNDVCNS